MSRNDDSFYDSDLSSFQLLYKENDTAKSMYQSVLKPT